MSRLFKYAVCSFLLGVALPFQSFAVDYQQQTLDEAHALFRLATNTTMYAAAAQQFEFLIVEEGIQNGHLFYSLGNCWFLAGDLGQAVLNYRRAELILPNNADIQYNLKAALELRTDLIPQKELHPIAAKLLGWHYHVKTAFRWWGFVSCWLIFWAARFFSSKSSKKEIRLIMAGTGILSMVLISSLLTEYFIKRVAEPGVILAQDVLARKGDGSRYAPAFLEPLHAGTEFQRMDDRGTWWQIRLANGQTCWIPSDAAATVSLFRE